MRFPTYRARRLREHDVLRQMVQETRLAPQDFIYPLFVTPGRGVREEISSMPGNYHLSVDQVEEEVREVADLGIPAVLLFGLPESKDAVGREAYSPSGVVEGDRIVNDLTLDLLCRTALSHVEAGADMVAPSDMMDGRVGAIRETLDAKGHVNVPIMAYAAKYASSFYGPFREAADSTPQFGDRRSYQMNPANAREALREVRLDIEEGADIVMVKPALAYLDVIYQVRQMTDLPVAAYNVSGEFAMIKAAARMGWLDEMPAMLEALIGIKRAGADIIMTYSAKEVVPHL